MISMCSLRSSIVRTSLRAISGTWWFCSSLRCSVTIFSVAVHLRLLQNHQVPEIARKLGLTIDDLKEHIEIIRHLDPKPGGRFNPTQSQYVIPDVYVLKVEDQYVVV